MKGAKAGGRGRKTSRKTPACQGSEQYKMPKNKTTKITLTLLAIKQSLFICLLLKVHQDWVGVSLQSKTKRKVPTTLN